MEICECEKQKRSDMYCLQHAILRRAASLPIIFTVRSKQQGGRFEGSEAEMIALIQLGVRLGCEFVDLESCWGTKAKAAVLNSKGISRIIASYHDFSDRQVIRVIASRLDGNLCGCWS